VEVIQRVIDARPEKEQERIALAAFVVSFATMGANLVDLYNATPPKGQTWRYFRHKTTKRRRDRAEVIVALEPVLEPFVEVLQRAGEMSGEFWLPALHRWKSFLIADTQVNKYLHDWQEREGLEQFNFYAARHTFATLARRIGVEKATVDEALAHVGDFRVTDIYAERNWELSWVANRKVLGLFSWPTASGPSGPQI
jgi:integrase